MTQASARSIGTEGEELLALTLRLKTQLGSGGQLKRA